MNFMHVRRSGAEGLGTWGFRILREVRICGKTAAVELPL
jgi:hypothetical protein